MNLSAYKEKERGVTISLPTDTKHLSAQEEAMYTVKLKLP